MKALLILLKKLIELAKEGGADAIKFQTYKASKLASKDSPAYWDLSKEGTKTQYELFSKYDKFWKNEFQQLADFCHSLDIDFLSTPFDKESAAFLNELMPAFKISSSDLNNKPFIEYLCHFNKPLILSTGASYLWEIEQAISWIDAFDIPKAILHCILNYPTDDANANLIMIETLKNKFPGIPVGYSDHTLPKDLQVLKASVLLGCKIIEKHFTHDKSLPGNDHYHAMDIYDLKRFKRSIEEIRLLLGSPTKKPLESEMISRMNARRSLVSNTNIKIGSTLTQDDITWKRPAKGIDPRDYSKLVGKKAIIDISEDTILSWDMFE